MPFSHHCIPYAIFSVCVPAGTHFETSHFSLITYHFHVILHSVCITSVCAPVGTHFEALLFYPTASYVSVAEAHSCQCKSILHSVCHFSLIASRTPLPRFACPWARISRHLILVSLYIIFKAVSCLYVIASVCAPVGTHFEALHFHLTASYVSVAETLSC